jgi:Arc/MetJ-type ribon-helix-helix transcriptional regulator
MKASKMMQVRVHPGLYRITQQAAADRYCDVSDYVRQALRERLERDGYSLSNPLDREALIEDLPAEVAPIKLRVAPLRS